MKKVSILQLKRNTNKLLKQAPLVVTSGGKPAYIVLDYDAVQHEAEETIKEADGMVYEARLDFVELPERKEIKSETEKSFNDEFLPKLTLWQRIKNLLTKKVF